MPRKQTRSGGSRSSSRGGSGSSKTRSQRQLRVGEVIRHALVDLLRREPLRDPVLKNVSVTISEVRASADMRHAKVFCAPLGGINQDEVLVVLNKSAGFLRGLLGREVNLKYTPELVFALDVSFDEATRINNLLASNRVAEDLAKPDTELSEEPGAELSEEPDGLVDDEDA